MIKDNIFRGKKLSSVLILSFLISIIFYGCWYFIFNIYEVKYEINFVKNLENNFRLYEIENIPLNLLGKKTPFRKLNFTYEILEGKNLIEVEHRRNENELFFKTSVKKGIVVFVLKTKLGLFPQKIELDLSNNFSK